MWLRDFKPGQDHFFAEVLSGLRKSQKDSPVRYWNFLIKKDEKKVPIQDIIADFKKQFPEKEKEAPQIVEKFFKNKSFTKFHKNVGPSILQRVFQSNLSNVLEELMAEIKNEQKKNFS